MCEVVTFQIGSFSNFIGAHFWNIEAEQSNLDSLLIKKQEKDETVLTSGIRSSSLWSEHEVNRQSVYRPRLIAVDLLGALGGNSVQFEDQIKNHQPTSICWNGRIEQLIPYDKKILQKHSFIKSLENSQTLLHQDSQPPSHHKFNFSSTVKFFSDFFIPDWKTQFHMSFVPDFVYGINRFDSFADGHELTQSEVGDSFWEILTDQFRHQFELCDHLSAVHLLVDWESGFGGIGAGVIEWLSEHAPKTSALVYGNQEHDELMVAETDQEHNSSDWNRSYRRVGGSLFLQSCINELSHERNGLILSDFNLSSLNPITNQSHRLSLGHLDFSSRYQSSAFPAVALDLLSMPYRLEGSNVFSATELFESVNLNNQYKPMMYLHLGCPIISDLLSFQTLPSLTESISLIERLWDVTTSPSSQPSRIQFDLQCDVPSLTQFIIGRGLKSDEEIALLSRLLVKERHLFHPDPLPVPIPFPQFSNNVSIQEVTELSSLACLRSTINPPIILTHLHNSVNRVIQCGRSAALETRSRDFDRFGLLELSQQLIELIHSQDSALNFD